ncbi:pentapeptide repeat-containing protein [Mycobacterium sp. MMS18-G62]
MAERVADAISEIARPNRDEQPEKPQIQADPAHRRPRLLRNIPPVVVAFLVLAVAVAAGWATFWVLGRPVIADRPGLKFAGSVPLRVVAAIVVAAVAGGLVAWMFRPAQTLGRGFRSTLTASRRHTARIPLFLSVVAAAVLGVGLAVLATWAVSGDLFKHPAEPNALDVVRAATPAIAGAVIAVALVLVFRRQKDSERARFAQRFGAASAQLGDSDVAVRIGGVYGMAAVADESTTFAHRQQCIDVLCGYLRLPYDPDFGSSHLSEFVSTTTWSATPPATNIEEQRRQAIRQNDREVRKTIVRAIARHLRRGADTSWSANDFDFTGVLFEDAAFDGARFGGRHVSFGGATFTDQNTSFDDAIFTAETVLFDGAKFESAVTTFDGATFAARYTSFDEAAFGGKSVSFDDVRFAGEYVSFRGAAFASEKSTFSSAKFKCLRASFVSPADWRNVEFDWDNAPAGSPQGVPRCITPRPWPPNLVTAEA